MHLPLPLLLRFLRLSVCLSILYCLLALLVCVIFSAFKFTMATSGCGKPGCPCGSDCQCNSGCSTLVNFNAENDCKCGPNCNCADCACHK
uniref:Metallothionein-like protein n=1 Tax=Physcomitrium patens TaxID=3218 RepID=A0A7I4FJP8_PHYPA